MSVVHITLILITQVGLSLQENHRLSLPPSGCTDPDRNLTLNCRIKGPGVTVWRDSFFDAGCSEISLRHVDDFAGRSRTCNDGAITATALSGDDNIYISQLSINLMMISLSNGSTITCIHDKDSNEKICETWKIIDSPMNLHLEEANTTHLKFSWDPFLLTFPPFRYDIHARNCGSCLKSVDSASVVCENSLISTDVQLCSVAIQSRCNEAVGTMSCILQLVLKVPEAPLVLITSHKSENVFLTLDVTIKEVVPWSDSVTNSLDPDDNINYTIIYSDADSNVNCASTVISASSCEHGVCKHMFNVSNNTPCSSDANIMVTAFATNTFGESPRTIVFAESANRLLSGVSDYFVKRMVVCEFPNDPTNGPRLYASNSMYGISCGNLVHNNMKPESDIGDPMMINFQNVTKNDGFGKCFITHTINDSITVITEGRLSTSIIGLSDKLKFFIVAAIVVLAVLIIASLVLVGVVVQCCRPSLKSIEIVVKDEPRSLIESLQVFTDKDINISCVDTLLSTQHVTKDNSNQRLKGFRIVYECPKIFDIEALINNLKSHAAQVTSLPDRSDCLETPISLVFTVQHVKGALLRALKILHKYGININDLDTLDRKNPSDDTRKFKIKGDFFKYTREHLRARLRACGVMDTDFLTEVPDLQQMDGTEFAVIKHQVQNSPGSFHNFLKQLLEILMSENTNTTDSSSSSTKILFIDLAPGDTSKQHQVCIVCAYTLEDSNSNHQQNEREVPQSEQVHSKRDGIKDKITTQFGAQILFRPLDQEEIKKGEISVGPEVIQTQKVNIPSAPPAENIACNN